MWTRIGVALSAGLLVLGLAAGGALGVPAPSGEPDRAREPVQIELDITTPTPQEWVLTAGRRIHRSVDGVFTVPRRGQFKIQALTPNGPGPWLVDKGDGTVAWSWYESSWFSASSGPTIGPYVLPDPPRPFSDAPAVLVSMNPHDYYYMFGLLTIDLPVGSTTTTRIYGCAGTEPILTLTSRRSGSFYLLSEALAGELGPDPTMTVTVSRPGLPDWTYSPEIRHRGIRWKCDTAELAASNAKIPNVWDWDEVDSGNRFGVWTYGVVNAMPDFVVRRWSERTTFPVRVDGIARATRTRLALGARRPAMTTYTWRVDGKRVGGRYAGPRLAIKPRWKGKKLTLKVTVSLDNYESVSRDVDFGRIRRSV